LIGAASPTPIASSLRSYPPPTTPLKGGEDAARSPASLPKKALPVFAFLLIVQTVVAAALIGVILMQRSEGGGLGVGGSSSGFMTARGAADFLTRSTAILGGIFIALSILMAAIAGASREPVKIDTSLAGKTAPAQQSQPAQPVPTRPAQPAQNDTAPAVPLAQ